MFGFQCTKQEPPQINRLISIMVLCLAFGTSYSSTNWPNEPAGSTEYVDCPFSNSICSPLGSQYKNETYVSSNGPLSPPYVLDDHLAAGASTGGGTWANETLPFPKEIYVGAWWSTNADFMGMCNNTNKMIFVKNSAVDNNFLCWQGAPGQPKTLKWYNQATYDNCGHAGEWGMCYSKGDGTGWFEPNGISNGTVAAGSGWHRIEFYLKTSTSTTSRDGVVRWWLDGQLVGNYPTVNLSPGGFREFYINHTWDGTNCLLPPYRDMSKAWHHYWDHLRISFPNCGSSGCPAPAYLVINSSLPPARTGMPFTATLTADGGTKPYTWFRQSGNLPNGLTLNQSTGVISGTPTCVGRSDFTIRVTDASQPALTATKSYTIITSGTGTCASGIGGETELTVNGARLTAIPGSGQVRFQLPAQGEYSLRVYDHSGREVWRHASSAEAIWNHGGKLKKGVYFVRAEQGGKTMFANYCNLR